MRIVLASKSPRRSEILGNIGVSFEVHESNFIEDFDISMSHSDIVKYLSYKKAESVAKAICGDALVIGADTIVVLDSTIMGKPSSKEQAFDMLKSLSGKWHKVYTGLCVINTLTWENIQDFEVTDVKIKELSDEEIRYYIGTGEPMDKAGSYAIQGVGSLIVERIQGCYFNVVGLPVFKLSYMLEMFGVKLLSNGVK